MEGQDPSSWIMPIATLPIIRLSYRALMLRIKWELTTVTTVKMLLLSVHVSNNNKQTNKQIKIQTSKLTCRCACVTQLLTKLFHLSIISVGNRTCDGSLNGAVRLVGGRSNLEGRVELCLDGEWGTICDNFWTERDAIVVCRQLGLSTTDAAAVTGGRYGAGNGSIHLDRFFCSSDEERITDCIHSPAVEGVCGHVQDAGVVCTGAEKIKHIFYLYMYLQYVYD